MVPVCTGLLVGGGRREGEGIPNSWGAETGGWLQKYYVEVLEQLGSI